MNEQIITQLEAAAAVSTVNNIVKRCNKYIAFSFFHA